MGRKKSGPYYCNGTLNLEGGLTITEHSPNSCTYEISVSSVKVHYGNVPGLTVVS